MYCLLALGGQRPGLDQLLQALGAEGPPLAVDEVVDAEARPCPLERPRPPAAELHVEAAVADVPAVSGALGSGLGGGLGGGHGPMFTIDVSLSLSKLL